MGTYTIAGMPNCFRKPENIGILLLSHSAIQLCTTPYAFGGHEVDSKFDAVRVVGDLYQQMKRASSKQKNRRRNGSNRFQYLMRRTRRNEDGISWLLINPPGSDSVVFVQFKAFLGTQKGLLSQDEVIDLRILLPV